MVAFNVRSVYTGLRRHKSRLSDSASQASALRGLSYDKDDF